MKKIKLKMNLLKNKEIVKVIGEKIQTARKNKNYTQEYVAEKIDKSIDTLRGMENGRCAGSIETLINLCNVLDITLDYIFFDVLNRKEEILDNQIYEAIQELSIEDKKLVNSLIEQIKLNKN